METKSMKQHMGMRAANTISNTIIHVLLVIISVIWLIPFVCIVLQSLRVESTWQVGYILPKQWGLDNFKNLLNTNFPKWYLNTFIIAVVAAALQTIIVLCMSYTLSRFRFKLRKPLMKFMLILGLFPGMLTMIILYRVLKDLGLTQANGCTSPPPAWATTCPRASSTPSPSPWTRRPASTAPRELRCCGRSYCPSQVPSSSTPC